MEYNKDKHRYMILQARQLRHKATEAEKKMWHYLSQNQMTVRFHRQYIIKDRYITDFCAPTKKLIVEIDGGQHCHNEQDSIRDAYLKKKGFTVLRFWNNDVLENPEGCWNTIISYLKR